MSPKPIRQLNESRVQSLRLCWDNKENKDTVNLSKPQPYRGWKRVSEARLLRVVRGFPQRTRDAWLNSLVVAGPNMTALYVEASNSRRAIGQPSR